MKVKIFLGFIILFLAGAKVCGQITLHAKKMPLEKVFQHIQQQTGYTFFYDSEDVEGRLVNINVVNTPLYQVLSTCLQDTPISFEVVNKTVILTIKESPHTPDTATFHMNGEVINFTTGLPISYASLKIMNSKKGVSAEANGKFELSGLRRHDVIEVRSVGFKPVILPMDRLIKGLKPGDTVSINEASVLLTKAQSYKIGLKQATTSLDEAIIVAYGTTTHRYDVGSVSVVKADEIELHPVSNVLQALQGQVPGLNIINTSGAPGGATFAQIRGQNTFSGEYKAVSLGNGYNEPLFIIDGVPFSNQLNLLITKALADRINGTGFFENYSGLSPLNTLNPADIESISILKDADATSIYGSTGSGGVILITTKRGKSGRDIFNINFNSGVTSANNPPLMMNTTQYLAMRNEADRNSAHIPGPFDGDQTIYNPMKYTNFSKEFLGGTAHHTDMHLSLSGGSENTTYFISGGSTLQQYNFPGDFADKRLTLHTSFNHKSKDHKLNLDFGTDYSYERNNSINPGSALFAFKLAPNTPDLIEPNGNLVSNYKGLDIFSSTPNSNPWANFKALANTGLNNLNTHLQISYRIFPSLTLLLDGGYSRLTTKSHDIQPISANDPLFPGQGTADFSNTYSGMISLEPQLKFVKTVGRGTLNVLLGATYWKNDVGTDLIFATGYTNDISLNSPAGAKNYSIIDQAAVYKYAAALSRINYVWGGKYIVNLTGNRNGSSNFGQNKKYGNFGSAGLGWIISEESFIRKALPFLSYLKLSGNYGTSGSDNVTPYQYQANWMQIVGTPLYQGSSGLFPANPENPDYSWALNKKLNESLDFGFLNNRIMLNLTAYQNKTSGQLTYYQIPATSGFYASVNNAPNVVENNGFEFSITSKNIQSAFKWSTSFNIAHNANKLTKFPGLASSNSAGSYLLGKPLGGQLVIPLVGVNPLTGVFDYRKKDGTITYNPNISSGINGQGGDATEYIDLQPKFTGGFANTFSYKRFSLSVFFQFVNQTGLNYKYGLYAFNKGTPGNPYVNLPVQLLSRWQKPGDVSEFERLTAGNNTSVDNQAITAAIAYPNSSGSYSDASYIRLKNLAFVYHVPQFLLKNLFIKDSAFYINAENLLTITNYKVGDPETQTVYAIPVQRIIVAGIKLDL